MHGGWFGYGLGWVSYLVHGLGWIWVDEMDPRRPTDNSACDSTAFMLNVQLTQLVRP